MFTTQQTQDQKKLEAEIDFALSSSENFNQKFKYCSQLILNTLRLPNRANALIEMLLNNPGIHLRLITRFSDLAEVASRFPNYADRLFKQSMELKESQVFDGSVPREFFDYTIQMAIKAFPDYMENLLKQSFQDKTLFQKMVSSHDALIEFAKGFPSYAAQLIGKVLSDTTEYERLMKYSISLTDTIKAFPGHAKEIIKPVITDRKEFERLITCEATFSIIGQEFPNEPIFKMPYYQARIWVPVKIKEQPHQSYVSNNTSLLFKIWPTSESEIHTNPSTTLQNNKMK